VPATVQHLTGASVLYW